MAIKPGRSSQSDEMFGFGGGLENSPFKEERYGFGVCFMVKKDKRKYFVFLKRKGYRYEDKLGSKKIATVPRQRR